jgi:hypothetical protein
MKSIILYNRPWMKREKGCSCSPFLRPPVFSLLKEYSFPNKLYYHFHYEREKMRGKRKWICNLFWQRSLY